MNHYPLTYESFESAALTNAPGTLETLSQRIAYMLQRKGIRKVDLAKMIGVKHQVIQYLCDRNVKNSKFIPLIAEALEVDIEWLTTGKGVFQKKSIDDSLLYEVPVLDEEDLRHFLKNGTFVENKNLSHIMKSFSNVEDHRSIFAFVLKDTSMAPIFPIDSIVFIDKIRDLQNEAYGLFFIEGKDILLRKILINVEDITLIAFNETIYKNVKFKQGDSLIGMVSEVRWKCS